MTNETKHTPGSWEIRKSAANSNNFIYSGNSNDAIAGVKFVSNSRTPEECEANARLIGAAPDLLEAVMLFVQYDSQEDDDGVQMMVAYNNALTAAKEAIAKATGKAGA